MKKNFIDLPIECKKTKRERNSVKNFKIDTSRYRSYGPRIIKTIDIKI